MNGRRMNQHSADVADVDAQGDGPCPLVRSRLAKLDQAFTRDVAENNIAERNF